MYLLYYVYTSLSTFHYREDASVDEQVCHQTSLHLVQHLNWELSQKKMIFSKDCIHLSKVVGQGLHYSIIVYNYCSANIIYSPRSVM